MKNLLPLRNCPECHGRGETKENCSSCEGSGVETCPECYGVALEGIYEGGDLVRNRYCHICKGLGKVTCTDCYGNKFDLSKCDQCDGSGQLTFEEYDELQSRNRAYEAKLIEDRRKEEEINLAARESYERSRPLRELERKKEIREKALKRWLFNAWYIPLMTPVFLICCLPIMWIISLIFSMFDAAYKVEMSFKSFSIYTIYVGIALGLLSFCRFLQLRSANEDDA